MPQQIENQKKVYEVFRHWTTSNVGLWSLREREINEVSPIIAPVFCLEEIPSTGSDTQTEHTSLTELRRQRLKFEEAKTARPSFWEERANTESSEIFTRITVYACVKENYLRPQKEAQERCTQNSACSSLRALNSSIFLLTRVKRTQTTKDIRYWPEKSIALLIVELLWIYPNKAWKQTLKQSN